MIISSITIRNTRQNTLESDTMYVARFARYRVRWYVVLFEKSWSEQMQSNEVYEINSRKFFFHGSAQRWVRKEIVKKMVKQHKLEIING
jgi:hypothetical protein